MIAPLKSVEVLRELACVYQDCKMEEDQQRIAPTVVVRLNNRNDWRSLRLSTGFRSTETSSLRRHRFPILTSKSGQLCY